MAKVIVFEKNGDIQLATLTDDAKIVCRENLKDFVPCPEELLALVPSEIVEFCKETTVHYLYLNAEGKLEASTDPFPI